MAIKLHEHLSAPGLLQAVRASFSYAKTPTLRARKFTLPDCLMSGLSIFGMKSPSLLQFDENQAEPQVRHNLRTLYGVKEAPCDTQLRERLDKVDPESLGRAYKALLRLAQRSGALKHFKSLKGYYPVATDGTGVFSSHDIHCENCCIKNHRDGTVTYHHQILSAVMVCPGVKQVLPLISEPIVKQDGVAKNDCELNAAKRLYPKLRTMHPKLKMLVLEDALYANVPHLEELQRLNFRYVICVKSGGNKALFEWVKTGRTHLKVRKGNVTYHLSWFNRAPLNDAHPDFKVNFLECYEVHYNPKTKKESDPIHCWTWITDIFINTKNALDLAKSGRTRWRIENETFNTLKNQGYHFEHNFGHGNTHLSTVFTHLMMLAFLIDQIQELCCKAFQAAAERYRKCRLRERMRNNFINFFFDSWADFLNYIVDPSGFRASSNKKGLITLRFDSS